MRKRLLHLIGRNDLIGGGASTLTDNIVFYYKMNATSGDELDEINTYNAGQRNSPGTATGQIGNCRTFTRAASKWFGVDDPSGIEPSTSDFTYSVWFQYTGAEYYNSLLHWGVQSSSTDHMWFLLVNGSLQIQFVDGLSGNNSMNTGVSFSTNTWHHICCTFDRDGNVTTYKNGVSSATNSISGHQGDISPANGIGLNCYYNDPGLGLDGKMDEAAFWHRALSGAEVTELYNLGAAGNPIL